MRDRLPVQGDAGTCGEQERAEQGDATVADAVDQRSGEERRKEHSQHVPLDDPTRLFQRQAAEAHGQRRGVHDQDHQPVSGRGAGDGRADHRLPQQAAYVAPGESCRAWRLAFAEQSHQQQAGEGQHGDQQIGADEGLGQRVARPQRQARRQQRGEYSAGEHVGAGAAFPPGIHRLQRGEPVVHGRGLVDPDAQRAETEPEEIASPDTGGADQAAEHAAAGAEHQPGTSAVALHEVRQRLHRQQVAQHQQGQGQGSQAVQRRQLDADQGGQGYADQRAGPVQGLAAEQQEQGRVA